MNLSKELIRYENAHSGLIFRELLYSSEEDALLVRDLLSLANAETSEPRWIIIGVRDDAGEERSFPGVDQAALIPFKQRVMALAAHALEPQPVISVKGARFDGKALAVISLKDCSGKPYLLREPVGPLLPGTGFIRRGTRAVPLKRTDLMTMFGVNSASANDAEVCVVFAGQREPTELTLAALPLDEMPSQLAESRLRAILEARRESRDVLGRTETRLTRLVHARMYGTEKPFEVKTDESLAGQLAHTVEDYRSADDYYRYEARAHKLPLTVMNRQSSNLKQAQLALTIRLIDGIGVSQTLYKADGTISESKAYPQPEQSGDAVHLRRDFDVLPAQAALKAFAEPVRLWVREQAAGKTAIIDYRVDAPGLTEPARGSLSIHFTAPDRDTRRRQAH